ncbi:MAG: hypothetical protein N2513_00630 [Deltaproteobacteria bacterium]|nr:hypothetical protein [Deltaproteobacteria bacterium]
MWKKRISRISMWILVLYLSVSCSLKTQPVFWPKDAKNLLAYCELDTFFRGSYFTGFVNLRIFYPDFHAQISGPLGNTMMIMKKEGSVLTIINEEGQPLQQFDMVFPFSLDEVIYDVYVASTYFSKETKAVVRRGDYTVKYEIWKKKYKICWENENGYMCLFFLDVKG